MNWPEQMSDAAVTVILIPGSRSGKCLGPRSQSNLLRTLGLFSVSWAARWTRASPEGLLAFALATPLPGTMFRYLVSQPHFPWKFSLTAPGRGQGPSELLKL